MVAMSAIKLLAAAALAVAMTGASSPSCERQGGVHSDRPPAERQADPKASRTVVIEVTEASGPYEVWVRAAEQGKDLGDHTRKTVAGGPYRQTLTYTSGLRIVVTITVTGSPRDIYRCQITDGTTVVRERRAGQVQCKVTTRQ